MKVRNEETPSNLTENQKIWWNEIKDLGIELYGLPDKKIGDIAKPINLRPTQLNLRVSAPAGIVAIEEALQKCCSIDGDTRAKITKYMMKVDAVFVLVKPSEGALQKTASGKYIFVPDEW
ncbi:MAG TPA: hypothetical protein VMX17_11960 [Candidatus Glassbacteria bacterium]|nr:hypothetical protein [Candidatus Glassbacteria bacterium]